MGLFIFFFGDGEVNALGYISAPERSLSIAIFCSLLIFLISFTYGVWINLPSAFGALKGVPNNLYLFEQENKSCKITVIDKMI